MIKSTRLHFLYVLCLSTIIYSCSSSPDIEVIKIVKGSGDEVVLDYNGAYKDGFVIPSKRMNGIDSFQISFRLKNKPAEPMFYKIYYQNESYKFSEKLDSSYNILASENFYGSWEGSTLGFKKIDSLWEGAVDVFFRISGNPRNEQLYYGINPHAKEPDENEINKVIENIKADSEWLKAIEEKANNNKLDLNSQLRSDAIWILAGNVNSKWKRNPRVGTYSALIVVTNQNGLDSIPNYIKDISKKEGGSFINPYYYFLHGKGKSNPNIFVSLVNEFITVKADVPLAKGIYVDYDNTLFKGKDYFNAYVGNSEEIRSNATFEYYNSLQANTKSFMNVPIHSDFLNTGYNKEEYVKNGTLPDNQRVKTYFSNTLYPGKTFGVDTVQNTLWFKNPGNNENEFKKENVGIKTRHGLTYGKYTFKIKMPKLLTSDNVWTGVTNAIWSTSEKGEWNERRICKKGGYMPYYGAGKDQERVPYTTYSEIDFEILKTVEAWPKTSYPDKKVPTEPSSHDNKIMVACTNWDMACLQPDSFNVGVQPFQYQGDTFNLHRWDHYYNALTSKYPEKDDVLFGGEYYYFQIDWRPEEIIWRIGPEKNSLHVVGYMNNQVTSIPNNQMFAVITQEYHFSEWWPNSPYKQENVPFPSNDLKGTLYSLEIE